MRAASMVVSKWGFDSSFWFYLHIQIDEKGALRNHASAEVSHLDFVGKPRPVGRLGDS